MTSIRITDAKILGYANMLSKQTQTTGALVATPVRLEATTMMHPSITLVDQTKIYIANDGPYNLSFSLQVQSTNSSYQYIDIWIRYNGQDYPWSNTRVGVGNGLSVASWNIFGEAAGGGYVELIWRPSSNDISLLAVQPTANEPGIPSAIVTVNRLNEV
jgi:hypothetical protein